MTSFTDRMFRAAKLDAALYEEVESDRNATGQAMGVVVLSALAAGLGHFGKPGLAGPIAMVIASLVSWAIGAGVIWVVGTKLLPEEGTKSDVGELLRTLGFASAPGMIRIFEIVPGLRWLVVVVAIVWTAAAMVLAVRQALDYRSTVRAVVVVLIGTFLYGGIMRVVEVLVMRHAGA